MDSARDIQKAAYVFAQAVAAQAEIEGMKAENTQREAQGYSIAYDAHAFLSVIERYGLHHNAIISLYNGE
jgi:hypothetical protein